EFTVFLTGLDEFMCVHIHSRIDAQPHIDVLSGNAVDQCNLIEGIDYYKADPRIKSILHFLYCLIIPVKKNISSVETRFELVLEFTLRNYVKLHFFLGKELYHLDRRKRFGRIRNGIANTRLLEHLVLFPALVSDHILIVYEKRSAVITCDAG